MVRVRNKSIVVSVEKKIFPAARRGSTCEKSDVRQYHFLTLIINRFSKMYILRTNSLLGIL